MTLNQISDRQPKIVQRRADAGSLTAGWTLAVMMLLLSLATASADELILDESLTEFQAIGDFSVSSCSTQVIMEQSGLLDDEGEMTTGQLYAFFKQRGINSLNEIVLSLDLDPNAMRADYDLNSMEFSIEDSIYTLGGNSIRLPAYESSALKPEAQVSIKLGYDFMQKFNEFSTEKIKFSAVDGNLEKLPLKVGVTPAGHSGFSPLRIMLLTAFAGFWVFVFAVLFRATARTAGNPESNGKATSPA